MNNAAQNKPRSSQEAPVSRYKITVRPNGHYTVSGGVPLNAQRIVLDADGQCLKWEVTRTYPVRERYTLCRCGHSHNRPFCDDTHKQIGFDGTETADHRSYEDQCQKYSGPAVDLTDARPLCAHAGFCDRAGGTWKLVEDSADPEARRIAIEEACNCPSGRLIAWDKDGQPLDPALEPSISVVESSDGQLMGPLWVQGGILIESADGRTYEVRNRVTLCGCGRSANKPFCDGTHREKLQPPDEEHTTG